MKITKQQLKQIIREELKTFNEVEAQRLPDRPVTRMDFGPETLATDPRLGPPASPVTPMEYDPEEMVVDLKDVDRAVYRNLNQLSKLVAQRSAGLPADDPRLAVYKRVADSLINLLKPASL